MVNKVGSHIWTIRELLQLRRAIPAGDYVLPSRLDSSITILEESSTKLTKRMCGKYK
jgi:hypothetical protein